MMSKEEKLDLIIQRFQEPENAERLEKAKSEQGLGIWWHFNRAQNSLKNMPAASKVKKALLDLDYSVSIRKVNRIMKTQGWK